LKSKLSRNLLSLSKKENWHRKEVGGLWDEIGKLQFDFLIANGMLPKHYFLDVGCGSIRGGVHTIQYLKEGHYFGIDKNIDLLDAGRNIELKRSGLFDKCPNLVQMWDFEFESLHQKFDYAMAQSVFTHLPKHDIIKCLSNLDRVLEVGGKFFATFFEDPSDNEVLEPILQSNIEGEEIQTFCNKDPFHYSFQTFEEICQNLTLEVTYIGDWNHPRAQKIMKFTK